MDPSIINENEELYQARESINEYASSSDSDDGLDSLISDDTCSL